MNIAANNVEEKAVHSWSRISTAGHKVLEEALRVFNPMSKDLSDTQTQLVAFLQSLKEEGYRPTVLRSKDVYGYNSCTAASPRQPRDGSPHGCSHAARPAPSLAARAASTAPSGLTPSPAKASKGDSTNLLLSSLKQTRSGASQAAAVGFPAGGYPDVYPAMRLSVVLEALVPLKSTPSCLEPKYTRGRLGISPSDLKLLKASSPTRQFSSGKSTKVAQGKGHKHSGKKAPDSATLTLELPKGPRGSVLQESNACRASGVLQESNSCRASGVLQESNACRASGVLQESNACKASGVLNGRVTGSSSQGRATTPQAKALKNRDVEALVGKAEWKASSTYQESAGQKKRQAAEAREAPQRKKTKSIPVRNRARRAQSTWNLLKFRAIKVGNSSSDDEVRRRAQKILRVNLSPVIRIQPLSHSLSVP
ncbi:coiled-coil domain-containing protein 71 [Colius striatus]|uniref:coiled-coil domain-containing protein 71 n=1 Tax=Colius striatus TaxID=57412 RepID=UPI002B1E363D|nr:coiled-coil domain-containing protein 71 [Colius striatus]XP_061864280.1 coiled-coil domain-containing protein 71 [Colius striatus]